jgi:putative transposase
VPGASGRNWAGLREVERETAEWVRWYNHGRIHSSIDYATPMESMCADTVAQQGEAA